MSVPGGATRFHMSSFAALFGEDDNDDASTTLQHVSGAASGLDAPTATRAPSGFVGLDNQGATCYMNSLLQTWFMIPEIRGALYSLDPEAELHAENINVSDMAEVRKLKSRAARKVPLHLQKLFTVLQHSQKRSVTTSELTTDGFGWKKGDARIQHDLDALYNELVDAVQKSLVKTSGEDLVRRLLEVRISNSIVTVTNPPYRSPRNDSGFSLQLVNLKGVPNLSEALDTYFRVEHLDDGKPVYRPDDGPYAGQKVPADRVTELASCPPIFAISVNRTTFDLVKLQAIKMKDRFDCPVVLDMRPYFKEGKNDGGDDSDKKIGENSEVTGKKTGWSNLPASVKGQSKSDADGAGPTCVTIYPADLKTEEGYARAKALSESAANQPHVYDLFAVVLHHGNGANSGHYTSYIRDTLGEGKWSPPEFKPKHFRTGRDSKNSSSSDDFEMRKFAPDAPLRLIVSILVAGKRDPGRSQLYTYDFGNLGSEIKKRSKGKKWSQRFPKKSWPSVKQFCRQCEDYFVVSASHVSLKRNKEQCLPEIKAIWDAHIKTKNSKVNGSVQNQASGALARDEHALEDVLEYETGMTDEEKSFALIAQMKLDEKAKQTTISADDGGWEEVSRKSSRSSGSQSPKRNKKKKRDQKSRSLESKSKSRTDATHDTQRSDQGWGTKGMDGGWEDPSVEAKKDVPLEKPHMSKEDMELQKAADEHYAHEQRLAEDWGKWFWFNDHKVLPITLSDVENAAVGKDSSRMLVYRSRRLPRIHQCSNTETEESGTNLKSKPKGKTTPQSPTGRKNGRFISPTAPEYWLREVIGENERIQAEREAYDRAINMVELNIHAPRNYRIIESGFYLKLADACDEAEISGEKNEANSFKLTMDARASIHDLKTHIIKELSERGLSLNPSAEEARVEDLMLSEVMPVSTTGFFHLHNVIGAPPARLEEEGLDEKSSTANVQTKMSWANLTAGKQDAKTFDSHRLNDSTHGVSSGATLMAWNGKSLPSRKPSRKGKTDQYWTDYQSGKDHVPISIRIIIVAPSKESERSGGKSTGAYITVGQHDIIFPASHLLVNVASKISSLVGIPLENIALHCIEKASSGRSSNFRRLDHHSAGSRTLTALKIFDGSVLCAEYELAEMKHKSGYKPLAAYYAKSTASQATFRVVDMMSPVIEGKKIQADELVEGLDSGGGTAARIEGNAYNITVNLSNDGFVMKESFIRAMPSAVMKRLKTDHQELMASGTLGNLSTTDGSDGESKVMSPIKRRPTDLTCRLRLHNPHGVRMPIGDSLPDGPGELLGDESKPFTEYPGLKSGDTLYVEFGRPIPGKHVAIRYFVVTGNLQTQSGGKGTRGPERWLHIHEDATVKMAMSRMCSETGLSSQNRRLREVNENGDLGKLCMELDRHITKYAAHGETLLLEEGKVPQKGVITLNMSLFVTPEERQSLLGWQMELKKSKEEGDKEDVSMLGSLVQGMKNMILGEDLEESASIPQAKNSESESAPTTKLEGSCKATAGASEASTDDANQVVEDAFIRARRRQQECVFPLAPRDVKKSEETLLSLKELLLASEPSLHKLAKMRGFELTDAKQLRFRELDKQTVPRYVFRDNAKTLSKIKRIAGSKRLAIQVLSEPEQLSNHAKLLFVQHRNLDNNTNSPSWPCNEIKLSVGPNPTLANLNAVLLRPPKDISAEEGTEKLEERDGEEIILESSGGLAFNEGIYDNKHLEIASWDAKALRWRRVISKSAGSGKKRRGKKGRRGPQRLALQDGDLIAFVDSRKHEGNPEAILWDREEDTLAQQYKQVSKFLLQFV